MKIKLFLAVLCALICAFALTFAVSAKEYTATSSEEFNTSFASAADGDTIIIKSSINATLDFGKSITYILDGNNIIWTAGANNTDTGKDVYIFSKNGHNSFMPNSEMWCNSYSVSNKDLSATSWTFGALDVNSTITLDMQKVRARFFYNVTLSTLNLKSGSIVTGINNTKVDNTNYLRANTVNIYDGAKIYGNYVGAYRGLFQTNTLNIFGGEIYGNYIGEYGFIVSVGNTATVNMYGGKVYENYLYFGNTGVQEGMFNKYPLYMYDGEIFNNYIKVSNPNSHSVLYGSKHIVLGTIHNNYLFSSLSSPSLINGIYTVESLDISQGTEAGNGLGNVTTYDYSVIFKNTDGSIVEAYLVIDGSVAKSLSGTKDLTVPNGLWTKTQGYCEATTPDLTRQGTYYKTQDHIPQPDDYDCTTALLCSVCNYTISAAEKYHTAIESLTYDNYCGYGTYSCTCANDWCIALDFTDNRCKPIFKMLGYSIPEATDNHANVRMVQGFYVNKDALKRFEDFHGYKLSFGAVVALEDSLNGSNPLTFDGCDIVPVSNNVVMYDANNGNNAFEIVISGINKDGLHPEQLDAKLIYCGYVSDGYTIKYIDNGKTYITPVAKSYNDLIK